MTTGPGTRRLTAGLVVLLLAPPVAAGAVWQWQAGAARAAREARDQDRAVLAAATTETLAWATVDYRKVDDYVAAVSAGATGEFLTQFQQSETALRTLLADNKSVQVPNVPAGGAGLVERSDSQAVVLVAMDASVTNKATTEPQPRQYRLRVTLTKQSGRWLTSGLEFIDAGS